MSLVKTHGKGGKIQKIRCGQDKVNPLMFEVTIDGIRAVDVTKVASVDVILMKQIYKFRTTKILPYRREMQIYHNR